MRLTISTICFGLIMIAPAAASCTWALNGVTAALCKDDPDPVPSPQDIANKTVEEAVKLGSSVKITEVIDNLYPTGPLLREAAKQSGDQFLEGAALNVEAIGTKLDRETQTAITNALTNPSQAVQDAAKNHIKAANDLIDAAKACERYAERSVHGTEEVFSVAEQRLREGKVVDAIWGVGTDKLQIENNNSAQLMEESEFARQTAQTMAGTYGGPAGTAAFAAWLTYNRSKHDVQKALMAGLYAYATNSGYSKTDAMSASTISETVKKAAATAAVRGLAVAAAGGSSDDVLNAAAQSGASVIVQSAQTYVTNEYVDPIKSKADTFCMNQVSETCGDAMQWFDASKKLLEQNKMQIEQGKIDITNQPTTIVTDDGQWAISWSQQALFDRKSNIPGVVLTYVGQRSPFRREIHKVFAPAKPAVTEPAAVPDKPEYYVSVVGNGQWINNLEVGQIRANRSSLDIYVDGNFQTSYYLYRSFDTLELSLSAGSHVLLFKADVRTIDGLHIVGDCSVKFVVIGADTFSPHIKFEATDKHHGKISECSLTG